MKHPDYVVGWQGSMEGLAKAIGNMKYNMVSEFLRHLTFEFERQSQEDTDRKRYLLAGVPTPAV